jgi:iron complex transport system substrate-binding protein
MTSELMLSLNPDVILVMTKGLASVGGVDGLVQLPGVAQTQAGKDRRVVAVDDSLLLSFGPRTPDLIKQLSQKIEKVMR